MGNKGVIQIRTLQWITAGSGIIHQNARKIQRLNAGISALGELAARKKMIDPKYRGITIANIPIIK